jgi:hypothetical protein
MLRRQQFMSLLRIPHDYKKSKLKATAQDERNSGTFSA